MIIGDGIVVVTEPNNNFSSAYNLGNIGTRIQLDSLSLTSGDLDYYRFSLNDGAYVTIETDGAADGDTLLYLYDSNQNLLISDDDSGTGYYSRLGYNLSAGTYYVMVSAYSGTVPNYSLEIRKETVISTEPNESFETAYDLGTVTDENRIDHQSISSSSDLDYYRFTLGGNGFVTVSAEGGNPVLALYDANRQLVTESAWGLLSADLEAGTYYVLAHSDGVVNNYDLAVKNYGEIPDLVLEGNYNSPVSTLANVLVKSGTTVNAYYPGGIQLQVSGRTVTVENNVSLNCNSIRNAAILFGEDAAWGDYYDGTVTFTGANATLSSKVSNCIRAGGIVGNNLTVNFTGAADNSSGITFRATQNTGPGNEADGIRAQNLTVNGNFGGNITCSFDFSQLSSTRNAYAIGLSAAGDLVFNGGISGTILTSCYTVDQSAYSAARGLYAAKTLTVTGDISGTIAALAEETAYAAFAYERLEISVTGTLFAGRATAGQTPEQFLALLNDPAANATQLKNLSASFKAVYGGAQSVVTLKAGAVVWGDIRLANDSVLTISSEATLYGNADFSNYNSSNVTFLLEGISEAPVVSGSLLESSYGKASITIDATNALNGQYTLAENWALTNANDFAVKAGTETISRSRATRSGNKYVFTFGSGMTVEWNSAAGLTLTVNGSPNTETADHEAPVLGGNLNAQVTGTNVSVSWNAASDNVGVTGYQFRYGNSEALSGDGISVSSNSCHLQDLSNGTYFYQIRAYDAAGNHSDWSEIQSFTVDYTPPVLVPYEVPQAEYMYGCTATVVGMLLGYYDRYGYMGYDVSDLIAGTVELNARGLDGNAYDMDAFDTVLGSAIASPEYVQRFVGTTPEQELPYTFIGNTTELNTPAWNCIADYLGTGQYWRGNGDLSTSQYFDTLQNIQNFTFTVNRSSGTITRNVPAQYSDFLYGLDLYVRNAGYQLDAANSKSVYTDNNGGSFSFADYKAEIDAGRLVIVHVDGHSMLGYGYDDSSSEIIFDDTYDHDCRMQWGGEYYYSNASRAMRSVSVVQFDTENLQEINSAVVVTNQLYTGNFNGEGTALHDVAVYRETEGGLVNLLANNGTGTFSQVELGAAGNPWKLIGVGDFNGDGVSDVLWRNMSIGDVGSWLGNGSFGVTWQHMAGAAVGEWEIVGVGDFNHDATDDVLWYNTETGLMLNWQVQNGVYHADAIIAGAAPGEWRFSGVGDFNGDGTDDILWHNQISGAGGYWAIQNGTYAAWRDLAGADPEEWTMIGIGDFDANGFDDVLWLNNDTGLVGCWANNSTGNVEWNTLAGAGDLEGWHYSGVGDFDSDGRSDVLWAHDGGAIGAWITATDRIAVGSWLPIA